RQGIHGRDAVDQARVEGCPQRHALLRVEEALQRKRGRLGVQQRAVVELDVLAQLEDEALAISRLAELARKARADAAIRLQAYERFSNVVDDTRDRRVRLTRGIEGVWIDIDGQAQPRRNADFRGCNGRQRRQ